MNYLYSVPLPPADLSHEETRLLLAAAQKGGQDARDALVQANLRLAAGIAQRFVDRGVDPEDLFQVACVGLIKAIDNFDLRFDVRFSTYAVPTIIGEIRRWLQQNRTLKIGRSLQERVAAVLKARTELTAKLERSPTPAEIAAQLGMQREDVVTALEAAAPVRSLDEVVHQSDDDAIRLADQISVEGDEPTLINNLALRQVYASLDATERALVTMRFFRNMRQTEVAKALGVSQGQVSRMEKRVMMKMRGLLG
ncbi:MAG: SigB/SigF/SigG family RNA polymerase sigma factor [Limnochordia bacterium]